MTEEEFRNKHLPAMQQLRRNMLACVAATDANDKPVFTNTQIYFAVLAVLEDITYAMVSSGYPADQLDKYEKLIRPKLRKAASGKTTTPMAKA